MKSRDIRPSDRQRHIDRVAAELLPQVSLLTRLVARQLDGGLSRSEARVLATLKASPRRITELAELDGVAQPTITVLAKRLEQRRLVGRARRPEDERVVMVSLTEAGAAALADYRSLISVTMREYLAQMSDEQIAALADASEALEALIELLQGGAAGKPAAGAPTGQKEAIA
jgi:DNA-binding MarR family transcriptional regulator